MNEDKFNLVRDYLNHRRKNDGVSNSPRNISLSSIMLFSEVNHVNLPWKYPVRYKGNSGKITDELLYTDD